MNLKELAKELGLSQTTVSRALNGYPEVAEATRRRVAEAAERLNYRPNTRARSLATGRSMAIGHVLPLSTKREIMNPIFTDFLAGAGEAYFRAGYDCVLSVVNDADEARVYRELAAKGAVDGLIVQAPRRGDPRIALLKEIGLPFVVHGRASTGDGDYSWIDVNNRRAFQRATEFLVDLGHRRIALINGVETMDFAARRRDGYLKALRERGIESDSELIVADEMTEAFGYVSTRRMRGLGSPPTAIICSSMIIAIGVRRALGDLGLRLARDVSVVVFDDDLSYLRNGVDVPIFTSLKASVRDMGRRAAELLLDMIQTPRAGSVQELIEADFMLGQSTAPAPGNRPATLEPG
jgi:LacI family transcriptional regulator